MTQLRDNALSIWRAAVDAVAPQRLLEEHVAVQRRHLVVDGEPYDLDQIDRIAVVGAGKAGAGMAAALETILGEQLLSEKRVSGWVNVPADCVRPLRAIKLHAARPAGLNEPTAEGVAGSQRILKLVASLGPNDLCLALFSGGGSALLPAPAEGITLADKQAVTQHLSAAGANIAEINTVRKQLSRAKGGRLAAASTAGRLVALLISDVVGDPLDVIASGPTVPDATTPEEALAVLERFGARSGGVSERVFDYLAAEAARTHPEIASDLRNAAVRNIVIGNNATAVDAAGLRAEQLGYQHAMHAATKLEPEAEQVGRHLAEMALAMRSQPGTDCLITGGEPVVRLADAAVRGRGGRNQQLALAAMSYLIECANERPALNARGIVILSGGTDGEDGPTDAAGAVVDESVMAAAHEQQLDVKDFLARNDAYTFFDATGGLIKTGPTHTNVCDVRVVLIDR
jgi:hydroxypyruvate reductase